MVFVLAVDFDRWGRWLALSRERIVGGVFQQGDMEQRVDLYRRGAKTDGVRRAEAGVGHNLERPKAAVVELARRAAGDDVLGIQPHSVAREEAGRREPVLVGARSMAFLGTAHLGPQVIVDLGRGLGRDVGLAIVGIVALQYQGNAQTYLARLSKLNSRVGMNGETLRQVVHGHVGTEIIDLGYLAHKGIPQDESEFLSVVKEAGLQVEEKTCVKARAQEITLGQNKKPENKTAPTP